jgi:hypothetical protein
MFHIVCATSAATSYAPQAQMHYDQVAHNLPSLPGYERCACSTKGDPCQHGTHHDVLDTIHLRNSRLPIKDLYANIIQFSKLTCFWTEEIFEISSG